MKKKILALLAMIMILSSTIGLAEENDKINWLIDQKIVEGRIVEDGSIDLALDENITRAEFTKVLVEGLKLDKSGSSSLKDIENHWAKDYINAAVNDPRNIIQGYEDGTFRPNENIKITELAAMLVRTAKDDLTDQMIKDAIWPNSYLKWAEEEDIFDDLDIEDPNQVADRRTAFIMLYNAFDAMDDQDDLDDQDNKIDDKDDLNDKPSEYDNAKRKKSFEWIYNTMDIEGKVDHENPGIKAGQTVEITIPVKVNKTGQGYSFSIDAMYKEDEAILKPQDLSISSDLRNLEYHLDSQQAEALEGAKIEFQIDGHRGTASVANGKILIPMADLIKIGPKNAYTVKVFITPAKDIAV